MSHFVVGVMVPKDTLIEDVEGWVSCQLDPYNEDTEVPEYEAPCHCIGFKALVDSTEKAKELLGDRKTRVNKFKKTPEAIQERENWEKLNELWTTFDAPFDETLLKLKESHPMYNKPDEACDDCGGTGICLIVENPKGKWDWFEIGGRWNEGFNPVVYQEDINYNDVWKNTVELATIVEISKRDKEFPLFSIVDPEGNWIERGEAGWWGMVNNEKNGDEWKLIAEELCITHQNEHNIVIVDFHV